MGRGAVCAWYVRGAALADTVDCKAKLTTALWRAEAEAQHVGLTLVGRHVAWQRRAVLGEGEADGTAQVVTHGSLGGVGEGGREFQLRERDRGRARVVCTARSDCGQKEMWVLRMVGSGGVDCFARNGGFGVDCFAWTTIGWV
eukprot:7386255-Prymnesium_polylepis.1